MGRQSAKLWIAGSSFSLMRMIFHRCGVASPQNDVEPVAQGMKRNRGFPVEEGDKAVARLFVSGAVEDRVEGNQRITGEIHLGDQSRSKCRSVKGKMNVCRTPSVVVICPRIFPGTNGDE